MAHSSYSFPILDLDEIHSCLHELSIDVTVDDLRKPQAATVQRIYTSLIIHCTGTTLEELTQPSVSALAELTNYPMHEESVPVLIFLRNLAELLSRSGVSTMRFDDIVNPSPKRLVRNLSAIINLAKFREDRVGVFTELTHKTELLKEQYLRAESESNEISAQYEEVVAKMAAEQPRKDAIKEECSELEAGIDELNRRQAVLKHENAECKAEHTAARDQLATVQFEVLNHEETIKKLEAQIVSSPDRLRAELRMRTEQLNAERESVDQMERSRREVQARLDAVKAAEADVLMATEQLGQVKAEYEKYRDVVNEVKAKKATIEESVGAIDTMKAQKKHLERLISKIHDKVAAFRPEADFESAAVKTALKEAMAELDGLNGELEANRSAAAAATTRKGAISSSLENAVAEHKAEMREMQKSFQAMRTSVSNYHRNLLRAITNTASVEE